MNIPCDNEPEQDLEPLHYKDSAFDYLDPSDGDDGDHRNFEDDRAIDYDYHF